MFNQLKNIRSKNTLLIGDLNIDILNCNNVHTQDYLNHLSSEGFKFLFKSVTRARSNSCLDHLILRTNDMNAKCAIYLNDLTDHYPIICNLQYCIRKNENTCEHTRTTRVNYKCLEKFLSDYSFSVISNSDNVDYLYDAFSEVLRNVIINFTFNSFKRNCNKNKNWINDEIKSLIKTKEKIYKKHKRYPFDRIYEQNYRIIQKELKTKIKYAKYNYFTSEFLKCNNIKKQWDFVNRITNTKVKDQKPLSGNKPVLAESINHFFINVGSISGTSQSNDYKFFLSSQPNSFYFTEATNSEIEKTILSLDDKKSSGYDKISAKVLKIAAKYHISFITNIINLSISSGTFPTSLKIAQVVPIHKSGNTNDISNFRPISLLPIFSKVLEKIVHIRLYNYLKVYNIISDNQYGFLPGLSTESALSEFTKFTYCSMNNNNKTAAIFLDISKAFDSVDHDILLNKLSSIGIRGLGLNWFTSYLKNRKQFVKLDNYNSKLLNIKTGVPQGSILGPLLFLLYINDFCKLTLHGKIITYADDTVILYSCTNLQNLQNSMNEDLLVIKNWFNANKLSININKTKFINFSIYGPSELISLHYHQITCNMYNCKCPPLQQVSTIKYLGLNVDFNLKWKSHVAYLINKLRYVLYKFYYIKKIVNNRFLLQLYYSWVNSIISYGIIVWGGDYLENVNPVIKIQNKIVKILISSNHTPSIDHYKRLNIFPIRHLFFFRVVLYFTSKENWSDIRNIDYNLRKKNLYLVPKSKKEILHKNIFYLGPKFFNSLPDQITSEKSPIQFKKLLKMFTLEIVNIENYF